MTCPVCGSEHERRRFCSDTCAARQRKREERERERDRLAKVAPLLADLCERADEAGDLVADGDAEPWRALAVLSEAVALFFVPQLPAADVRALREGASPWVPA
jgi:predicted nucleic acid-binding Zn ribbon protein